MTKPLLKSDNEDSEESSTETETESETSTEEDTTTDEEDQSVTIYLLSYSRVSNLKHVHQNSSKWSSTFLSAASTTYIFEQR